MGKENPHRQTLRLEAAPPRPRPSPTPALWRYLLRIRREELEEQLRLVFADERD